MFPHIGSGPVGWFLFSKPVEIQRLLFFQILINPDLQPRSFSFFGGGLD